MIKINSSKSESLEGTDFGLLGVFRRLIIYRQEKFALTGIRVYRELNPLPGACAMHQAKPQSGLE